jgi:sugar/nucleoside kinase (ribokinase family)
VTVIGCVQADVLVSPITDLPRPGGTLLADQMSIRVGGAGANAALACVEAGITVRLMGCLGEDHLGRWMHEQLGPAGLASELVRLEGTSGLTVALESPERDRTFLTYLGVNAHWDRTMIPDDALRCENLLLCDYFVAPALRGDAARAILEEAQSHGATTFFDTAWDPDDFPPATREEVRGLLPHVDVFLPNEAEACALTERVDPAECARLLQEVSGGWVIVKLGSRGSLAAGPNRVEFSVGAPAVTVADTTGAGDAFNAGLVHALHIGAGWADAIDAATRFASMIVSRPSDVRYPFGLLDGAAPVP